MTSVWIGGPLLGGALTAVATNLFGLSSADATNALLSGILAGLGLSMVLTGLRRE